MAPPGDIIALIVTSQPDQARDFYEQKLGLPLVEDEQFALVFDVNGIMLRVTKLETHSPAPFTVLGFDVVDISSEIFRLTTKGIIFEQFEGLEQDERGICTFSDGTQVAWFRDPDGNMLSLTEFGQSHMSRKKQS
jgi:catechol 2,3-dioxygenase-like lactoylglutathione lyase family enzyme